MGLDNELDSESGEQDVFKEEDKRRRTRPDDEAPASTAKLDNMGLILITRTWRLSKGFLSLSFPQTTLPKIHLRDAQDRVTENRKIAGMDPQKPSDVDDALEYTIHTHHGDWK